MTPLTVVQHFDKHLAATELKFCAVVIGGTALSLLNVINCATRDVDVLDPNIDEDILAVATLVAQELTTAGVPVEKGWLNNGPISLQSTLPIGWRDRLRPLFSGEVLELSTLGREDLLKTKRFAYCDRGFDHADRIARAPTEEELAGALPWLQRQDANPGWPEHATSVINALSAELQHGV